MFLNIIEVLLKEIGKVQQKNKANPKEETADSSVFDILREKVQEVGNKSAKAGTRGQQPKNILDMLKTVVDKVRRGNKKDPNVPTAPGSIFDKVKEKVEAAPKKEAQRGIKRIAQEYNLDLSILPAELIEDINLEYKDDLEALNKKYAEAAFHFIKEQTKQNKRRK